MISNEDFLRIWREKENKSLQSQPIPTSAAPPPQQMGPASASMAQSTPLPNASSFEAGKVFAKYDHDGDGKLNKQEFEELVKVHPHLLSGTPSGPFRPTVGDNTHGLPVELVTGRLITHYDETACVGITAAAVEQHKAMGNVVYPLIESYKNRYDRLRTLLTARLLPRRYILSA